MHASKLVSFICLIGILVVTVVGQNQVCYEYVGCFQTGSPWTTIFRPVPPPQGPDIVRVFFLLYTRDNPDKPFLIIGSTNWSVDGSYYDSQKPTIVVTHGFEDSTNNSWTDSTKDALLKSMDANVILVDYGSIKNQSYNEAVANSRLVGALVSKFLEYLIHNKSASPSRFHLVGFSLGAHISGYVGKRIPGIGRITGLDPAQPLFEGQSEEVRLNKGDAIFVDVAHTNGSPTVPLIGLGYTSPLGDVDFYFNGGWDQPGCTSNIVGLVANGSLDLLHAWPARFGCPHLRAVQYFNEAMGNTNCTFWAKKRDGFNAFFRIISGGWLSSVLTSLSDCSIETCIPFGQRTFDFPGRGAFDITTATSAPYCIKNNEVDNLMKSKLNQYNSPAVL